MSRKSTPTYQDLFDLHIKHIETILHKTYVLHQYTKNIQASGSAIEVEIRKLLRAVLPKRFHVTHGYIVKAENQASQPIISPQVDLIIVDTLVPHSIFGLDDDTGLEIVPIEAVVGIFEIKRELKQSTLISSKKNKGAFEHLAEIQQILSITKCDSRKWIPGGLKTTGDSGLYSNPMIGIIGGSHAKSLVERKADESGYDKIKKKSDQQLRAKAIQPASIDIVASLSGLLVCICSPNNPSNLDTVTYHQPETQYPYVLIHENEKFSSRKMTATTLFYICKYVQHVCGRHVDLGNYYLNDNIS
jgi:hypothetical protein